MSLKISKVQLYWWMSFRRRYCRYGLWWLFHSQGHDRLQPLVAHPLKRGQAQVLSVRWQCCAIQHRPQSLCIPSQASFGFPHGAHGTVASTIQMPAPLPPSCSRVPCWRPLVGQLMGGDRGSVTPQNVTINAKCNITAKCKNSHRKM